LLLHILYKHTYIHILCPQEDAEYAERSAQEKIALADKLRVQKREREADEQKAIRHLQVHRTIFIYLQITRLEAPHVACKCMFRHLSRILDLQDVLGELDVQENQIRLNHERVLDLRDQVCTIVCVIYCGAFVRKYTCMHLSMYVLAGVCWATT
jgi:hypothetical protein